MKICEFLMIFCCWFLIVSQCDAVTVNCEYKNDEFWFSSDKNTTISGYFCDLMDGSKSSDQVTDIGGQHQAGKADGDVKILKNSRNNLKTFSSIFCQKFQNLENIWCSNVEIGSIDENSLQNCAQLDKISLRGSKLRELPEKLLAENLKLTLVRIWENDLTTLPENFFKNQNQLEQVVLYENQISFLPPKIFHPLVNLKYLNLQDNKLQFLDPEWFVNLKSLKFLNFVGNQISEVPGGAFKPLKSLEKLWLRENKVKILSSGSFEGLQKLNMLFLSNNEISELPRGVFVSLKNLKWLYLHSNKLTVIHSHSFGYLYKLIQIDLQDNKIAALDEKMIDIRLTAVKFLDMRYNLCYNGEIKVRNEMKEKLRNCFQNYRPQPTATSDVCGISIVGTGNIIGGTQIIRNSFPWITALVLREDAAFFCGGTLVTEKKVVTAAHCIQPKGTRMPTSKTSFYVWLGLHDLKVSIEPGRIAHVVETIKMHHDWDPAAEKFDADIAVLVLEQTVVFTRNIQPICLIEPSSNIASIMDGIVVGFGKSEDKSKMHENVAKVIDTPIVDDKQCFVTNYNLAKISSLRTFCGGTANGTGVCEGDSGSGLFVNFEDVYYLRGIVSASLHNRTYGCDVNTYSVFTDMLKYYDWVNRI